MIGDPELDRLAEETDRLAAATLDPNWKPKPRWYNITESRWPASISMAAAVIGFVAYSFSYMNDLKGSAAPVNHYDNSWIRLEAGGEGDVLMNTSGQPMWVKEAQPVWKDEISNNTYIAGARITLDSTWLVDEKECWIAKSPGDERVYIKKDYYWMYDDDKEQILASNLNGNCAFEYKNKGTGEVQVVDSE